MILSTIPKSFCMSLKTTTSIIPRRNRKSKTESNSFKKKSTGVNIPITKRQIVELFFDTCTDCERMAAIPQGVFAARKIRENRQEILLHSEIKAKDSGTENKGNYHYSYSNNKPSNQSTELTPLKYNSKLMNSIWGLYNRYSVHNFKKNTDSKDGGGLASILGPISSPESRHGRI